MKHHLGMRASARPSYGHGLFAMQLFVIALKVQLEGWIQLGNDPCHTYSVLFDHTQK